MIPRTLLPAVLVVCLLVNAAGAVGQEPGDDIHRDAWRSLDPDRTLYMELPADRVLIELPFTPLPDDDVYAPEVGFIRGFPAARDLATGRMWLVHCPRGSRSPASSGPGGAGARDPERSRR